MTDPLHRLLAALGQGGASSSTSQVFLVQGDLVLAEPAARKVAEALAAAGGGRVEPHRRPISLAPLLADLRTFSLFGSPKVLLAIDTAAFADRSAAADLVDDAEEALPLAGGAVAGAERQAGAAAGAGRRLSARERQAASRLLQALRLFGIDAGAGTAEQALDQLPAWVFEGGRAARRGRGGRGRGKRQLEELRAGLAELLEAARGEDLEGRGEGEVSDLAAAIADGLPAGHALVFAERQVAPDHPLARLLAERGALAAVGEVEAERGGWQGVDLLAAELAEQTGVGITGEALAELARRTLRKPGDRPAGPAAGGGRGGDAGSGSVSADSTARLAAEYRKLANLARAAGGAGVGGGGGGGGGGGAGGAGGAGAGGGVGEAGAGAARIERRMVEEAVEDRGEEDVWKLLDAIGAGQGGEAMDRLQRLLAAADDPVAARLSFFGLLANFCRRLTAMRGMMRVARVPGGETNYNRFSARLAPALQGDLPGGRNPLAGVKPWPLFRTYLAASRIPEPVAARLPWEVLETELQLKGESADADAALARLVVRLSAAAKGRPPGRRPGA
jgi:hypothetical protein